MPQEELLPLLLFRNLCQQVVRNGGAVSAYGVAAGVQHPNRLAVLSLQAVFATHFLAGEARLCQGLLQKGSILRTDQGQKGVAKLLLQLPGAEAREGKQGVGALPQGQGVILLAAEGAVGQGPERRCAGDPGGSVVGGVGCQAVEYRQDDALGGNAGIYPQQRDLIGVGSAVGMAVDIAPEGDQPLLVPEK